MVQPGFDAAPNEVLISTKCKFSSKFSRSRIPCFKICRPLSEGMVHEDDGKEYSDNEDSDNNRLKDCHYI